MPLPVPVSPRSSTGAFASAHAADEVRGPRASRRSFDDDSRRRERSRRRPPQRDRLAAKLRLVERAARGRARARPLERLRQVVVRALPDRLDGGVDGAVCGHHDDGSRRVSSSRRERFEQLEPVELRHAQIGDEDVETLRSRGGRGGRARRERDGVVAAVHETRRRASPPSRADRRRRARAGVGGSSTGCVPSPAATSGCGSSTHARVPRPRGRCGARSRGGASRSRSRWRGRARCPCLAASS